MSEPHVTLTAADMEDPELLAELAAVLGEAPPPRRRATAPPPPDQSQLRAQAEAKKQEALRLKRAGDVPGASQALRQYKALQAQLAAPPPAATPAGSPAPAGDRAPLSTDDLAAVLDGRVAQNVGSILLTEDDLNDPELLAELAAVLGGPPLPPPSRPAPTRAPPKSQTHYSQPQPPRLPPAGPVDSDPPHSTHAGVSAAGAATPVGRAPTASPGGALPAVSSQQPSAAQPPLPLPSLPSLPAASADARTAAVPSRRAELQARLSEARAEAARAKSGGLKVEAMRALRLASRLQEELRGMEVGGEEGGGTQPAGQEAKQPHQQQPRPPPPTTHGQPGKGADERGRGMDSSSSAHNGPAAGLLGPEEDEAEAEMARLVEAMNAPDGGGNRRAVSGGAAISGGGGASKVSRGSNPSLSGASCADARVGFGMDGADEDQLQRLLDSMSRGGGGEDAALSPELAGLLAMMAGGGPAPAEEEVPPELARLVQQMNSGPGAGRRGEEHGCAELDDLVQRMSGASLAPAGSRQGGIPGGAAAGGRGGDAGGKVLSSAPGSDATKCPGGSPMPDLPASDAAAARRRAAEELFLASDEGQMLLAAGVPADEILASLPGRDRQGGADGAPAAASPTHPSSRLSTAEELSSPHPDAPVPPRSALSSNSVLSLTPTPSLDPSPSLDSVGAASVASLRAEAFRLKQAGDVQGALAKLRQAKGMEAAGARADTKGEAARGDTAGGDARALPSELAEGAHPKDQPDPPALSAPAGPPASAPPLPDTPPAVSASGLAAHVAALKREAVALKRSGDVAGAVAKLRQARDAEAAGAVPPAAVAAEGAQATVMARAAAAAAAAMAAVAMVETQREETGDEAGREAGSGDIEGGDGLETTEGEAEALAGGEEGAAPAAGMPNGMSGGAEVERGAGVRVEGEGEGAANTAAEPAAATAAQAPADVPLPAVCDAPTAPGSDSQPGLPSPPTDTPLSIPARIEALKRQAVAHKQAGRGAEAIAALREMKQLQAQQQAQHPGAAPARAPGGGSTPGAPPPLAALPAAAVQASPPPPQENLDLTKLELEVTLISARLMAGHGGTPAASFARVRWEMLPGAGGECLDTITPPASPSLAPEWRHKTTAMFAVDPRRSRSIARHVATGKAAVEVWAVPGGFGRFLFGAREVLMGSGELRMSSLLEQATVLANVPLREPNAAGGVTWGANIGHVSVQMRVRTPIGATPPPPSPPSAPPPASPPPAPPTLTPRASAAAAAVAADEDDDMGFVNSIVSYDVLERLTAELQARREVLEAKGAVVPLAFEARQQALEFRREMIQIQVGGEWKEGGEEGSTPVDWGRCPLERDRPWAPTRACADAHLVLSGAGPDSLLPTHPCTPAPSPIHHSHLSSSGSHAQAFNLPSPQPRALAPTPQVHTGTSSLPIPPLPSPLGAGPRWTPALSA
jgi:hypothetical protein